MSDDDPEILRPVLARFAAGWGASVDCGEGWWPIIAQLDRDIAAIESAYEVHQILAVPAAGSGRGATGMPKAALTFSRSNRHRSIRRRSEQVPARGR